MVWVYEVDVGVPVLPFLVGDMSPAWIMFFGLGSGFDWG